MRRLLPSPISSVALLIAWLMLNESASAGQWLLGALLALVIPWLLAPLRPERSPIRSWTALARLVGVVLWDIVRSNVDVARRVLGRDAAIQPRFVWVPIDLTDPLAIVLLAGIVTTTPGTISAELSDDHRWLLVHALHAPDDAAAEAIVADIKARYEAPLSEVFG
ncbi:Na+/H+ antiporter subunit E [Ideonella sp. A 288]|uniref:Na+/H+ antiporter subunit E n=1 Tax=Ideonella sp. A 288 TaxID=1962181 RepID=UPI000B4ADDDB|nr:Na+/H+ antiporter subunit E [Ideonella sp. A 288]